MTLPGEDTIIAHGQRDVSPACDCQRCPELLHELGDRDGALRILEQSVQEYARTLQRLWPQQVAAKLEICEQRKWIRDAPHHHGCALTHRTNDAGICTCGRDALLPETRK